MTWPLVSVRQGRAHTAWTNGLEGPMYAVYWCVTGLVFKTWTL